MASDFDFTIAEWWDHNGHHHEGHPTDEQLLDDATEITGHITDGAGNDLYFNVYSDDGWTPEEVMDDASDAYEHYV